MQDHALSNISKQEIDPTLSDCEFKKILFLGSSIHFNDASAITISNLFRYWPKEKLFIAAHYSSAHLSWLAGYRNIYSMYINEYKLPFPLNLLKNPFAPAIKSINSGVLTESKLKAIARFESQKKLDDFKKDLWYYVKHPLRVILKMLKKYVPKFLLSLGVYHELFEIKITSEFREWVKESRPDFIYTQLASRALINLTLRATREFKIPVIVHIMDDWPSTIVKPSFSSFNWKRKIDYEFRELLMASHKTMAISEKMATEYEKRYGGRWSYYHNPIDSERWLPFQKSNQTMNKTIKIGYFGRIGIANESTIEQFIGVIENIVEANIELHVYSQTHLRNAKNVFYHPFVDHSKIPEVISSYDLLLLPLSFSKDDIIFAKYSIPTKASEYMISGVPIILIAPNGMALTEFFEKYQCGLIINSDKPQVIKKALIKFINDQPQRELFSRNGIDVAQKLFDINSVHESFKEIFT